MLCYDAKTPHILYLESGFVSDFSLNLLYMQARKPVRKFEVSVRDAT